jgi:small-conductance mechanosensitive channel
MPEFFQQQFIYLHETLLAPDYWWQVSILVLALSVAAFVNSRIQVSLESRSATTVGLRHIAVRSVQRLLWPVVALLMIAPASAVLAAAELPDQLMRVAVPVLTALAAVRFSVYLLRKAFTINPLLRSSENLLAGLIWLGVIFHLLGWLPAILEMLDSLAVTLGETRVSVLSLFNVMILVAVAFILALWLADVVNRQVNRLPGVTLSFKVGVSKFSRFLLMTLAFLLALNAAGINLSSLAIFGGALGVGLGFGLQRIASNFISGFILVLDRSIKPGDVITVGDKFGWVQELNARYIVVRNREGVDTLIPNENLITSEVINWSYADPNVRVIVSVQISYDDDPEQAMQVMMECASASPRVLSDPAPTVRLIQFADSGIELQLRFWIADPANGFAGVKSDIHVAIWRAFKREGITIPYPQRDLHIKSMPARN